jgi:UDP-N-acetylglucosamine 2-epimerase (non-hydrolysing)/GDP/UDP-N,N'-diacetylbacillosamine 2-epimerase (hydrolysing)
MRALQAQPEIDLQIIATAAHLAPGFGETISQFARDGFPVAAAPECLLDSDSDTGMAKTIGLAVLSLSDTLAQMRPDLLLLIADRYEMLAPAAVALALRIPIAHIEGGEVSEGAIDDAVRNALSKMSHLHFVPTQEARQRVLAMGEEGWRVHHTGAPSLDHLVRSDLVAARTRFEAHTGLSLNEPPIVASCHPVTLQADPIRDALAMLEALAHRPEPVIFCFPNADTGHARIIEAVEAFCAQRPDCHLFTNLAHLEYWALLKGACLMVGNSSSGIMETPSLRLPCVNIGRRQQGRARAGNIIDCDALPAAIADAMQAALEPAFRTSLEGLQNPYGDGSAGEQIAAILAQISIDERLLHKRALPLADGPPAFSHE